VVQMEEEKSALMMVMMMGKRKDGPWCYGIIVRWTLRRMGGCGLDLAGSGQGQMSGSCVYGNELWGFVRMRGIW